METEGGEVVRLEDFQNFLTLPTSGTPLHPRPIAGRIVMRLSNGVGSLAEAHTCGFILELPTVHSS